MRARTQARRDWCSVCACGSDVRHSCIIGGFPQSTLLVANKRYACIGLYNPKSPENVGSVMRAAGCYGVASVFYTGKRYERARDFITDTKKIHQDIPLIGIEDLKTGNNGALHAERRPGLGSAGFEILTGTGDHVPPRADGVTPECLHFGLMGLAVQAFAFRAQHQSVDVAADPAGKIPCQRAAVVRVLPFQFLGQKERVDRSIVDLMARMAGVHRCPVCIGDGRDRGPALPGRGLCSLVIGHDVAGVVHPVTHSMVHAFHVGGRRLRGHQYREAQQRDGQARAVQEGVRCLSLFHSSTRTSRNMPISMWYSM